MKEIKWKFKLSRGYVTFLLSIIVIIGGVYIIGTPEYSLYKLKQAIISNNDTEFKKYLDIESIAENFKETPSQSKEWIDSLNTTILEIRVENPDRSNKESAPYIDTGLTGENLKSADLSSTDDGYSLILLNFDNEGAKLISNITKTNTGKKIAIFIDGSILSTPVIEEEITDGKIAILLPEMSMQQATIITDGINENKFGQINGFKERKREVSGNTAKITIGQEHNKNGFELTMTRDVDRHWRVVKIDTVIVDDGLAKLPSPEGEKEAIFKWKYKGKDYSLDEKLYESYYEFYKSLPADSVFNGESLIDELEKRNDLFITKRPDDETIKELAQSIKKMGEENGLNENQIVELVTSFVQSIPYDYDEYNNRNTVVPKIDYPYEVLYKNKGICSDKSYLAYSLLRELGYGASFFLFPEDQHIAVGVECPQEYSNYDSGYCFLETTSLGNKIGSTPSIIKESGIASSEIVLSDFGTDATENQLNPLGKIEVLNKSTGLIYTGIIDTISTQKEINSLLHAVRNMDSELNASGIDLDSRDSEIEQMVDKLKRLEKSKSSSAYDEYNTLYSKYKKEYANFEKDRKAFNAKITSRNQLNNKYNSLVKNFYQ